MRWKMFIAVLCVLVPIGQGVEAYRPSRRSLHQEGHENKEARLGAYNRPHVDETIPYESESMGVQLEYSWGWESSYEGRKLSDAVPYEAVHFSTDSIRKQGNRVLTLSLLVWDVGRTLSLEEMDTFVRDEFNRTYRELWVMGSEAITVDGHRGLSYRLLTMTGDRQEVWLPAGDRLINLKYRSLSDPFDRDYHFFADFVSSVKVSTPVMDIVETASPFMDMGTTHSHFPAVSWAKETGVAGGYPDGTFQPDRVVNRAEFLKMLLEARGDLDLSISVPTGFSDVDEQAWYVPYLRFAKAKGIIEGYPDNTFRPEQAVNFAEALKMVYVTLGIETAEDATAWYQRFLNHAKDNDILFSRDADVAGGVTRKDVVWILWRLIGV